MKIWERHGFPAVPFVVIGALIRRSAETVRLAYWRTAFGWKIGRDVRVHWSVSIPKKIKARLDDGAVIGCRTQVIADGPGGALQLGRDANIAHDCILDVTGALNIGSGATISEGAAIYTHSHGRNPRSAPRAFSVTIGDAVWICSRAMVLSSASTIGERAIIGPYEVVRGPVPADTILVRGSDHDPFFGQAPRPAQALER